VTLTTIDPATGEPLATYDETGPDQLDHILDRALAAAAAWRLTPPLEQADGLRRLARSLRANREKLALLATPRDGQAIGGGRRGDRSGLRL
jgi:acyl-CoA reductase-like NAD-dependent aldehyde dehydrogenase